MRKFTIAALAFALVAAIALLIARSGGEAPVVKPFPDKTAVRVALPPQEKGESIRYNLFDPDDQNLLLETEIEYETGVTGHIYYRPDRTIAETSQYWPGPPGQRQVKARAKLDADGKTHLSDRAWRKDGTLERSGNRQTDGSYDIVIYFADGVSVNKHQSVSKTGKAVLEEVFRQDGSKEKLARQRTDGKFETTTYAADGTTRLTELTESSNYWENPVYRAFYADGVTARMKVSYSSYNTEVEYYRVDGSLREKRSFTTYSGNATMSVTVYGGDGRVPTYKQEWRRKDASSPYILRAIEVYNGNGDAIRKIEFHGDGATPMTITEVDPPGNYWGGTRKSFRADGTLETVEVRDSNGNVRSTSRHAASEGIREKVPGRFTRELPYEEAPAAPKRPPQPDYGPYGPWGYP